jgi:hypothetical protein
MLLENEIKVITISREEITLSHVNNSEKIITGETKKKWNPENKEDTKKIIDSLKEEIGDNKVRLLFKENVFYLIKLPFSEGITRKEILTKISEKIPEKLDEYTWDYKIEENENEKKIVAFAPVKNLYEAVVDPLRKAKIKIEAAEPEEIAKRRHENPIIGIALKKDIKGKDENVLNLKSKEGETKEKVQEEKPQTKTIDSKTLKPKSNKDMIFLGIATALLIGSGVIMINYFKTSREKATLTNEIADTAEIEKDESPETILEKTNILILDTQENKDKAQEIKTILQAEGFKNIEIDNLGNSTEITQVQIKEKTPEIVIETIERALNSELELEFSKEYLEENAENSVILMIGQRSN